MRIKARRKPARKSARPARRKTTPAPRHAHKAVQKPAPGPIRSRGVLVAIVALSGAVIVAAMGRARGPEIASADVLLSPAAHLDVAPGAPEIASAPVDANVPVVPEQRTRTAMADTPAAAAPAPATAPTPPPVPEAKDEPAAVDPAVLVTPAATIEAPTATIAGCLTFDAGEYRLKDATGTDAPKARSWKSGFMAKRSATIEILDSNQSLGLAAHVGQRVEIGGTLVEREMQARSLHRLADSCKK